MSEYIRGTARSTASINDELEKIQNSLADKLDRTPDVGQANEMLDDIDMNSKRIYNVPSPDSGLEAANKDYVDAVLALALTIENATAVIPLEQARATGDGVTTTYDTPAASLQLPISFNVYLDGVRQKPTTDYTVDVLGNVEFVEAPENGVYVDITFFQPST